MKNLTVVGFVGLLAAVAVLSHSPLVRAQTVADDGSGRTVPVLWLCVYHKKPTEKTDSGGYAEPEAQGPEDSVKDILRLLADDPTVNLAKEPAKADVSLEVVSRQTREGGSAGGFILPNGFGGFTMGMVQGVRRVVFVNLHAPGYTKPIIGRSDGYWTQAAKDVVTQAMKWINANRQVIVSKRPF